MKVMAKAERMTEGEVKGERDFVVEAKEEVV